MTRFSFRELSALGSALIILYVSWLYFPDALWLSDAISSGSSKGLEHGDLVRDAFGIIILVIVLEIAWHILLSILLRQEGTEAEDERDRGVEVLSKRNGYYVLDIGIVMILVHLFVNEPPSLLLGHYLLMTVYAAEFVKYLSKFAYYRLGA